MTIDTLTCVPKETKVDIGVQNDCIPQLTHDLSVLLASCYVLTLKSHSFHWIVSGPHFYSLHKLSEEHYEYLFDVVDKLAERIRALGKLPPRSFSQILSCSKIPEFGDEALACQQMLEQLLADHEAMARLCHSTCQIAEEAHDIVTADLVTSLTAFHENAAWVLRTTLTRPTS